MDWTQTIKIIIAEREYPIRINSEDEEERIRKAGRLINDRLKQYKQRFGDKDPQDLLAYTALQFAVKTLELDTKASSTEQADKLKQMDEQLDTFLKQCTDC